MVKHTQTIHRQKPTNCLRVFDHFLKLALKGLRNRLSEVTLLIIDELSMVSSDLWADIDSMLGEIFMMFTEKPFAGLSVMAVADLLQLPPVRGRPIFSQFSDKDSMKHLLGLQL